ncbi:hypothetical protein DCS_05928 [Drechmeria coniospora]|uniref:Uncharacterized protein n=1 Tax=Drechmeria coniospora TaxID=98403 RepID=A0A151GA66_DRECN|nr:hypothetical protein DCS_05928 [Drechmeria coniospora]KYK53979.1 hypothetical protein DCS_05928 [Drechmeria coniospora]
MATVPGSDAGIGSRLVAARPLFLGGQSAAPWMSGHGARARRAHVLGRKDQMRRLEAKGCRLGMTFQNGLVAATIQVGRPDAELHVVPIGLLDRRLVCSRVIRLAARGEHLGSLHAMAVPRSLGAQEGVERVAPRATSDGGLPHAMWYRLTCSRVLPEMYAVGPAIPPSRGVVCSMLAASSSCFLPVLCILPDVLPASAHPRGPSFGERNALAGHAMRAAAGVE